MVLLLLAIPLIAASIIAAVPSAVANPNVPAVAASIAASIAAASAIPASEFQENPLK